MQSSSNCIHLVIFRSKDMDPAEAGTFQSLLSPRYPPAVVQNSSVPYPAFLLTSLRAMTPKAVPRLKRKARELSPEPEKKPETVVMPKWKFREQGKTLVVWSDVYERAKKGRQKREEGSQSSTQESVGPQPPKKSHKKKLRPSESSLQLNSYLQGSTGIYASGSLALLAKELGEFLATWGVETADCFDIEQ